MNRDLSLSNEKRFSFIHTITIYPHQNEREFHQHSPVDECIGVEKTLPKIQKVSPSKSNKKRTNSSSSALCTQDNTKNDSSLNFDRLENIPSTISNYWYSFNDFNRDNSSLSTVIYVPESESVSSRKSSFNRYLDKILLIFAGGYFCFVFWWLFAAKNDLFPIAFLSTQETISQADAEFIDYMKESLEVIDSVAIKQSSAKEAAFKDRTDVVYVPVYTPNPLNSNNQNNLPSLLPPPPPSNNLAVLNPPISTVNIQPPIPPSESVKVKTTPAESFSENSETTDNKSTPESNNSDEIAVTITPKIEHTLVGLMELKEGSAALFKIDGVTQRIWLGEEIVNTGWVLDSVANQKATVSYGGKILTLSVGETFRGDR